jgi:hypothetical protein
LIFNINIEYRRNESKTPPLLLSFYTQLISLLLSFCQTVEKSKAGHFTRNRKLPLPRLIVTLLQLTASGSRHDGVDLKNWERFSLGHDAAAFGRRRRHRIAAP